MIIILCISSHAQFVFNRWHYKCIDMLAAVQKGRIGSTFKVFQVEVRRDASEAAYYVDEVYIGKDPTVVEEGRKQTETVYFNEFY